MLLTDVAAVAGVVAVAVAVAVAAASIFAIMSLCLAV